MDNPITWLHVQFESAGRSEAEWNTLVTTFGKATLSTVSRYGSLVLTPDFIAQGLFPSLFSWFYKWRAVPVVAVSYQFTPAETTLLYAGRTTYKDRNRRTHSTWLSPQLYSLGPSIFLILRTEVGQPPLQQQIRDAKGRSFYVKHSASDLRGISPIADCCFSLVHSADDYEGFFHESDLILGTVGTQTAFDPSRLVLNEDDLISLAPKVDLAKEPHPFDLIFRLIEQGLALLLGDPRTPASKQVLKRVLEKVRQERTCLREVEGGSLLVEEAWKALSRLRSELSELTQQNTCYKLGPSLHDLRLANARIELTSIMAALCDRQSFNPRLSFAAIDVFQRNHLPLESWDRHRLHVLAAFHGEAS